MTNVYKSLEIVRLGSKSIHSRKMLSKNNANKLNCSTGQRESAAKIKYYLQFLGKPAINLLV
jgi:hypothetical protein